MGKCTLYGNSEAEYLNSNLNIASWQNENKNSVFTHHTVILWWLNEVEYLKMFGKPT